jgi:hypothetical protein
VRKLIELVTELDALDADGTIYAAEPWTEVSVAIVAQEPESGGLPVEAEVLGLKYFLEVIIAREVLDGWTSNRDVQPTLPQKCARLIKYAIYDA